MQISDNVLARRTRKAAPPIAASNHSTNEPGLHGAAVRSLSQEQQAVRDAGLLDASGVLCMPTGSGKTWLARVAVRASLRRGLRAVVLTPLRAIARELAAQWQREFAGYRISVQTGEVAADDGSDNPPPAAADIIVATPEKLDLYCRRWSENLEWLAQLDLVVVDELHTMAAGRRGATLEGLLTRLRAVNPFVRYLGLSATLGNPEDLASWFGGRAFVSRQRPVPLEWSIRPFSKAGQKETLVVELSAATVAEGGQVIVFTQSRPRTETLALALQAHGLSALAHHAGLSRAARDHAEAQYRSGAVSVLVATPTLAMGVNLPARRVVLADLQRFDHGEWADLPVSDVWQLAGRAGRPGLDDRGEVVLLAPRWNQVAARSYVEGQFEAITSPLASPQLFAEQVMVTVGSRLARRSEQVQRVLARSFLARSLPPEVLAQRVSASIADMVAAGMLDRDDNGQLQAARLGHIATRFLLSPATVLAWKEFEQRLPTASLFDLLMVVCASPDFSARLRVTFEDLPDLQQAMGNEPLRLGELARSERRTVLGCQGRSLVAAARTALLLRAWTRLGDMQKAGAAFGAHKHEVDEARKEAARLLQAMQALLAAGPATDQATHAAAADEPDLAEKAAVLGAMVAAGADDETATLTLLDGIGPVLARRLAGAGITDIEALALASVEDFAAVPGISTARAARWIEAASALIHKGGALRYREIVRSKSAEPPSTEANPRLLPGLDRYRWLRARALVVEPSNGGWRVTGGSEPHQVTRIGTATYRCDCQDAAKRRLCKHELAVRHAEHDPGVPRFDADETQAAASGFDLIQEWNEGATQWK